MSKYKFKVGDIVTLKRKAEILGFQEVYGVAFNAKIEGERFCGLVGGSPRVDLMDDLAGFLSTLQHGGLYSMMVISEEAIVKYSPPVYVSGRPVQRYRGYGVD